MPENQRPIIITNKPRSRFPRWLAWIFGCCGGCLLLVFGGSVFLSIIIALLGGAGTTVTESLIREGTSTDKIVIIPINGIIMDDTDGGDPLALSSTITTSKINNLLVTASKDPDAKAILLRMNTPGGSFSAARKICEKIKSVNLNKPIYTYIDTEGASAGYYIANCTRYIISDDYAITGSIGVIFQATNYDGLLNKLGIETKTITNTKGTQKESDLFAPNSKDEVKLKSLLDDAFEEFIHQVVEGRSAQDPKTRIEETKVRTLATGEIYSGKQAKANGLIDETSTLNQALDIVKSKSQLSSGIRAVQYVYSSGLFSGLSSSIRDLVGVKSNSAIGTGVYSIFQP